MTGDEQPTIRLLGVPTVIIEGKSITSFRSNRIPALIGLLASRRKAWPRENLAARLWPDSMPTEGRHNLRQTLLLAKELLGDQAFISDRNSVELAPEIETDVQILLQVSNSFRSPSEIIENAENAASLVRGEFMDGFDDDWILAVRAECSQAFVNALLILSRHFISEDPSKSLDFAVRAIDTEPFLDGARAQKILALRALGEDAAAHHELRAYRNFLFRELGIEPSQMVLDAIGSQPTTVTDLINSQLVAEPIDIESSIDFLLRSSRPKHGLGLAIAYVPNWIGNGRSREGIVTIRRVLESAASLRDSAEYQAGQVALCELLAEDGKLYDAKEILTELLPSIDDQQVRLKALLTFAKVHGVAYQAEAGEPYAKQALELAISEGSLEDKVDAYRRAAETAFLLEKPTEAEALAEKCAEYSRMIDDWRSLASVWLLIATIHLRTGRTEGARHAMDNALQELPEIKSAQISNIRMRLFRLVDELGDTTMAEQGYREGIQAAREFDDQMGLAICLTYLGDLLTFKSQLSEALELHLEALAIRRALHEPLGEATSLRGLGRIYRATGRFDESKEALRESSRLYLSCDSVPGHASALLELGKTTAAAGESELALRIAIRSRDLLLGMSPLTHMLIGPTGGSAAADAVALVKSLTSR